jgi:hypothetical protein
MGLYYNGSLVMGGKGFAFAKACCRCGVFCYCYSRFINYGSQLVEQRRVCYRNPYWDGSKYVYPDGPGPCFPNKPEPGCTVSERTCSCPGGGNPYNWTIIDNLSPEEHCTTVSPPP